MLRSPFCGPLCQVAGPAETANASAPHRHIWLVERRPHFPHFNSRPADFGGFKRERLLLHHVSLVHQILWVQVLGHHSQLGRRTGPLGFANRDAMADWYMNSQPPGRHLSLGPFRTPIQAGQGTRLNSPPTLFLSVIQFNIILDVQQNVQQQFLPGKMPRWNVANRRGY